ncbi:hypothetical protein [Actinomycetospora atypica]|uniref:Uncharacterized protein n=1 Tax=Actinomycetospora atypica TaxID=1290095 RepID=A0ABV9YFV0_9PSEU
MHIGRIQRRFTAEPILSPVPGAEAPVEEPDIAVEPVDAPAVGSRAGVDTTP